jgi:hypothetical protein
METLHHVVSKLKERKENCYVPDSEHCVGAVVGGHTKEHKNYLPKYQLDIPY